MVARTFSITPTDARARLLTAGHNAARSPALMNGPGRRARCDNVIENSDLSATPCTGLLRFGPGDVQASCATCGAWCGYLIADYIDGDFADETATNTT